MCSTAHNSNETNTKPSAPTRIVIIVRNWASTGTDWSQAWFWGTDVIRLDLPICYQVNNTWSANGSGISSTQRNNVARRPHIPSFWLPARCSPSNTPMINTATAASTASPRPRQHAPRSQAMSPSRGSDAAAAHTRLRLRSRRKGTRCSQRSDSKHWA